MLKLSYHHGRKKGRRVCAVSCRDELCFLGWGGVFRLYHLEIYAL